MTDFTLQKFLISLIIFSLIIGSFALVYGELGKNYNVKIDTGFNSTYDKIQKLENTSIEIGKTLQTEDAGALDVFVLAGKTILIVPKITLQSLGITTELLSKDGGLLQTLGVPPIFGISFLAIITILVIFAIFSIWARYKSN